MKLFIISICSLFLFACSHQGKRHGGCGKGKCHHAKMWDKMDADKDGVLTKKEFDTAHAEKFKKMDANGDGKVSKDEKMAYKKAMHSQCKSKCDNKKSCEDCTKKKECKKCDTGKECTTC